MTKSSETTFTPLGTRYGVARGEGDEVDCAPQNGCSGSIRFIGHEFW